jgi:hypothetical protein
MLTVVLVLAVESGCMEVPADVIEDLSPRSYTFTSGPELSGGDGFAWPSENSGLLVAEFPQASFATPHGVSFQNGIGNNLFFDDNYLLPDDAAANNGIVGEALWGNPRDIFDSDQSPTLVIRFNPAVARVAFDLAWVLASQSGSNPNLPDDRDPSIVSIVAQSSAPEGGGSGEVEEYRLDHTFPAGAVFQGSTGYSGHIELTAKTTDGIGFITIFVDTISNLGASSTFAIDNFEINGGLPNGESNDSVDTP